MANHRNFAQTTLAAAITDTSGTSITVTSETSFPSVPFIISIDTECMLVTNVAGTTWTVTRGYEGSTAATHTNGAAIYHDISAAEADSIAGKLDKAGGTMSGAINMGNQDISYLKLLKLNGEIDDGNSGTAKTLDWGLGLAHKVALTGNVTLAFTGYGADASPTMTSDTAPSGVASASSEDATQKAYKAFDGATPGQTSPWVSTSGVPQYLQYQFTSAKTIIVYSIQSGTNWWSQSYPHDWTLRGSNNGTDWTTIDTVTDGFTTGQYSTKKYFTVDAPGSYLYYRINVTATNDANNFVSIDEVEFYESATLDPSAPCFLALKLVQDGTGGRKITWPANVKGTPLYDLTANAVTVLLFYWDGTYYWPLNNSGWVSTVPASATAKGIAGQYTANGSYFYYCSATDTWVRTALATWT